MSVNNNNNNVILSKEQLLAQLQEQLSQETLNLSKDIAMRLESLLRKQALPQLQPNPAFSTALSNINNNGKRNTLETCEYLLRCNFSKENELTKITTITAENYKNCCTDLPRFKYNLSKLIENYHNNNKVEAKRYYDCLKKRMQRLRESFDETSQEFVNLKAKYPVECGIYLFHYNQVCPNFIFLYFLYFHSCFHFCRFR